MSRLAVKLGNMTLDDQKIPVKLVYINGTVISDGACFNGKVSAVAHFPLKCEKTVKIHMTLADMQRPQV